MMSTMIKGTWAESPARRMLLKIRTLMGDEFSINDSNAFAVMERVLRHDSNCIDIGCAQGLYIDQMRRLAPAGRHLAFEPIPALYQNLRSRFDSYPNIAMHNLALSNQSGTAEFHWNVTNPGWSGLSERNYPSDQEQIKVLDVVLKRLDDMVPADLDIDLIKIDVEGAELKVLEGAVGLLRRCRPVVIFEYGLGSAEFYEAWPEQMFDLLQDAGLTVSPLETYLADGPSCDRNAFIRHFHEHLGYYFVAHPAPAAQT